MINFEKFMEFQYMNSEEKVGKLPTLRHEIIALYESIDKYLDVVNYAMDVIEYRRRGDKDGAIKKAKEMAKNAAAKLLWLNVVCRDMTGDGFVIQKIDKASYKECRELIVTWYKCQLKLEAEFFNVHHETK